MTSKAECVAPLDRGAALPAPDLAGMVAMAQDAVSLAEELGCTAIARMRGGASLAVTARHGALESRTGNQGLGLEVIVHAEGRRGRAATALLDRDAVAQTVRQARELARHGDQDQSAALAEAELLAPSRIVPIATEMAVDVATLAGEALAVDAVMVETARDMGHDIAVENAGTARRIQAIAIATSSGFAGAHARSQAERWALAAVGPLGGRRMASRATRAVEEAGLMAPETVAAMAVRRAAARLGGRPIASRAGPVLIERWAALELIGTLASALSGPAQVEGSGFLNRALGTQVLARHLTLHEDPGLPLGLASQPFDSTGIAGRSRTVVEDGIVTGYFLDLRSARRLGMAPTGNADGPANLTLTSSLTAPDDTEAAMLRKLGTGFFLTELQGQGMNLATGDFSRAAAGFWVENGQIAHAVEGVTVVGNLRALLAGIVAVGADVSDGTPLRCGSLLVEHLDLVGRG